MEVTYSLATISVDAVWSLYVDSDAAHVFRRRKNKELLKTSGAYVWLDDSDAGVIVRVVAVGSRACVTAAEHMIADILMQAETRAEYELRGPPEVAFASQLPAYEVPDELVHFTQQIPTALMGLVIGVKGASIHAIEHMSACHLSLDRSIVHSDEASGVPFVLLHVHGPKAGALVAIDMCSAILQRHLASSVLTPSAAEEPLPQLVSLPPAKERTGWKQLKQLKLNKPDQAQTDGAHDETPTGIADYDFACEASGGWCSTFSTENLRAR